MQTLKNTRIEDITKIFFPNPYHKFKQYSDRNNVFCEKQNCACDKTHFTLNMINHLINDKTNYKINDIINDVNGKDTNKKNRPIFNNDTFHISQSNAEYLLSIHSTKERSRHRKHIKGPYDVIVMDTNNIDMKDERIINLMEKINNEKRLSLPSISFSGGGYNCVYHIGVVKFIFDYPELFVDTKYLGASAGAGIVSLVLCYQNDVNRYDVLEKIINFIVKLRNDNIPLNKQVEEYSALIFSLIDIERFNKYIKYSDRCHISVTNVSKIIPYNEIITDFDDYDKFIDTLKASACVPILLDDKIRMIDGKYYLDGGLSNNQPILNSDTLKVSCLSYPFIDADIYPVYLSKITYTFIPPDIEYINLMREMGYYDISIVCKDKLAILDKNNQQNEIDNLVINILDAE